MLPAPAGPLDVTIVTTKLKGELGESAEVARAASYEVVLVLEPEPKAEGFVTLEETKVGGGKGSPLTKVTDSGGGEVTETKVSIEEGVLLCELMAAKAQNVQNVERATTDDKKGKPRLTACGSAATEETDDKKKCEESIEIKSGV